MKIDISASILKRLSLIPRLLELGDIADINEQIKRLEKEQLDIDSKTIIKLLKAGAYHEAIIKIEDYISSRNTLDLYIDPEVVGLQLEIKNLENIVIDTESEVADLERKIAEFNHRMQLKVGQKMEVLYKLKRIIAEREKDTSEEAREYFEETDRNYQEFKKDFAKQKEKDFFELGEGEKEELKKIFRSAALLCHPDRFADGSIEDQGKAESIFKELQNANEKQDLATVKLIYEKLQKGILDFKIKPQQNIELLKTRLKELRLRLDVLLSKLSSYKESETIIIIENHPNSDVYFTDLEARLDNEIERLKKNSVINEQ